MDWKRLEKFKVLQQISPYAYVLQLSQSMKVHSVFQVSLLEPATEDLFQGQISPPLPLVEIDGKEDYTVQEVLDS